jgi:hypothetical protein
MAIATFLHFLTCFRADRVIAWAAIGAATLVAAVATAQDDLETVAERLRGTNGSISTRFSESQKTEHGFFPP